MGRIFAIRGENLNDKPPGVWVALSPFPRGGVQMRPVQVLLSRCSPSAVIRLVVSIIVDTVKGVAGWARAHVCDKVLKRVPPLTNLNTPTAIQAVAACFGIVTAITHRRPSKVHRVLFSNSCTAMLVTTLSASTGLRFSIQKVFRSDGFRVAAITLTEPGRATAERCRGPNRQKNPKSLISKSFAHFHNHYFTTIGRLIATWQEA